MQMMLNTAWITLGMRHAQVDDMCAVPYVTPAAMRPPGGADNHVSAPPLGVEVLVRRLTDIVAVVEDAQTDASPVLGSLSQRGGAEYGVDAVI